MTAHGNPRFTTDEWALLTDAPLLAAMMVLAAGRRGTVRGTFAVIGEYAAARERDPGRLVADILGGPAPDVRARVRRRKALAREAPGALLAAMDVLARKASDEDREDFARFVLAVAAAAARVGGEQRRATLDDVAAILSRTSPSP